MLRSTSVVKNSPTWLRLIVWFPVFTLSPGAHVPAPVPAVTASLSAAATFPFAPAGMVFLSTTHTSTVISSPGSRPETVTSPVKK